MSKRYVTVSDISNIPPEMPILSSKLLTGEIKISVKLYTKYPNLLSPIPGMKDIIARINIKSSSTSINSESVARNKARIVKSI